MARAIVAEETIDGIDPHEHRRQIHSLAIVGVLGRAHRYGIPDSPIHLARLETVARGGDQFAGHHVVRLIGRDRGLYILVKRIAALEFPVDVGGLGIHLEEVPEKHRPFIDELGTADQLVHLNVALRGVRVRDKCIHVVSRWNTAGQVKRDTAEKLGIGSQRCRLNTCSSHAAEDHVIDERFMRNLRRIKRLCVRQRHRRHPVSRQTFRNVRTRYVTYFAVNLEVVRIRKESAVAGGYGRSFCLLRKLFLLRTRQQQTGR